MLSLVIVCSLTHAGVTPHDDVRWLSESQ